MSDTAQLAADTLTGDVASFLIDRLRDQNMAYNFLSEEQQREVINDAKRAAEHLVERVVSIIAADGKETIPIVVKKVENNGEIVRVTIEASKRDENRYSLFDAAGCPAHLVIADPAKYEGGEMPEPTPDQPDLPEAAE